MGFTGIKIENSDYAEIPSDGKRYELLEGDFQVAPATHQRLFQVKSFAAYAMPR